MLVFSLFHLQTGALDQAERNELGKLVDVLVGVWRKG